MALNLRELAEADLATTLEGDFALPVTLIAPDGVKYTGLKGQVFYDTNKVNPDTGEMMTVNTPVVTLRRSSLTRIPLPGEKWIVKIPTTPSTTATLEDFIVDQSKAPEGSASIGYIQLFLRRAKQA